MLRARIETKPGSTKQSPGRESATGAVQQPADVDGKLLGLGTGQQHAVVQGVEEAVLADPALLLDQDAVHHRDLAGRSAKTQQRDARPAAQGFAEGDVPAAVACLWMSHAWPRDARSHGPRKGAS